MSDGSDWSPDEQLGTETFEQGDEALDDKTQLDPGFLEAVELDPSLDPTLQVDDRGARGGGRRIPTTPRAWPPWTAASTIRTASEARPRKSGHGAATPKVGTSMRPRCRAMKREEDEV